MFEINVVNYVEHGSKTNAIFSDFTVDVNEWLNVCTRKLTIHRSLLKNHALN